MLYGNETADVGLKFERPEIQMSIWICGVSMKERFRIDS